MNVARILLTLTGLLTTSALAEDRADAFDFYVLALSWSPSYCLEEGRNETSAQCAANGPEGFVVHGLWPQFERGYPEYCETRHETWLDDNLIDANLDIIPSRKLIIHQWRKHGVCSGLSAEDYFALARKAALSVTLPRFGAQDGGRNRETPDGIEAAFSALNDGLDNDEMAVTCSRRNLREVRICLTKDLEPRSCPEVDAKSCTRSEVVVPVR